MNEAEHSGNVLEVNNLIKKYGDFTAVDNISFAINSGTCFGLLGPNGAGKTTTTEAIAGIMEPGSGEILYKGRPRGKRFQEEVGIQFQNTELPLYLTVRETLATFSSLYGRNTDFSELVEICHLEDILESDNRKISGGQKQRLLLAMALANDPDLIFLDEPTTGLDPQARRHLWDIVFQLKKKNKTIVLTTHYMEEAQLLCDYIVIMDHGRFIQEGEPSILLADHCQTTSVIIKNDNISDKLSNFTHGNVIHTDHEVEIQTNDITACLTDLLARDIDLIGINVRSQNLEDLFLKLTGHGLR